MARKEVVELTDDLDGSPATQTLRFGFGGVEYEIDLNDENATELSGWLHNYISHARRLGGRKAGASGRTPSKAPEVNAKAVRAWAAQEGIEVNARGRIPSHVIERYIIFVGG